MYKLRDNTYCRKCCQWVQEDHDCTPSVTPGVDTRYQCSACYSYFDTLAEFTSHLKPGQSCTPVEAFTLYPVTPMAISHWGYTEKIIMASNPGISPETVAMCKTLYTEAFIHGYKHGQEGK